MERSRDSRSTQARSTLTSLEQTGCNMQQSTQAIAELLEKLLTLNQQERSASGTRDTEQQTEEDESMLLASTMLPHPLRPRSLPDKVMRRSRFYTFSIFNPLKLTSSEKPWDSPIVSLGGEQGYRAFLRVFMFGTGTSRGKDISVEFHLCHGPYDEWLAWPFPGKMVSVAMFRINGREPHAVKVPIEQNGHKIKAIHPAFISIGEFMDDKTFLSTKNGPDGKDDVLLMGFAVEEESTFCSMPTSSLECRMQNLERMMQNLEKTTKKLESSLSCIQRESSLPEARRGETYRFCDPFSNDHYHCC